eukprot:scaffold61357_cov75-Phaeocystis_antarctica.AAC.3
MTRHQLGPLGSKLLFRPESRRQRACTGSSASTREGQLRAARHSRLSVNPAGRPPLPSRGLLHSSGRCGIARPHVQPATVAAAPTVPAPVRKVEPRVVLTLEQLADARPLLAVSSAVLLACIDGDLSRLAGPQRGQLAHTQHTAKPLTRHHRREVSVRSAGSGGRRDCCAILQLKLRQKMRVQEALLLGQPRIVGRLVRAAHPHTQAEVTAEVYVKVRAARLNAPNLPRGAALRVPRLLEAQGGLSVGRGGVALIEGDLS